VNVNFTEVAGEERLILGRELLEEGVPARMLLDFRTVLR
jgi:hypothetical protein